MPTINSDLMMLGDSHGIAFEEQDVDMLALDQSILRNFNLAMDAQPTLITVGNTGIPAYLSSYIDPRVIEVLVTPNKAAKILGEVQKGDWVTRTAIFSMVESTGEVSSYGDWNNNGTAGANVQFPQRQSYHYQTITQWGEKQLAEAGLAKIDWSQRLNIASAMILDKFQNNTYFFGVSGLVNYGLLNDPYLYAPIAPATKAAGGTTWAVATPTEVFNDIQNLYRQLAAQSTGVIDMDSPMKLVMSPAVSVSLQNTNSFNVSVRDQLKKNFPNLEFETAIQYATTGGQLIQLIVTEVEGQETGYCGFTEKMRAHAVIKERSAFSQKKSQGSWGTIIFNPFAIAQMIGV